MNSSSSILEGLRTLDITELVFPRLCNGCSEPLLRIENHFCLLCQDQLPLTRSWESGKVESDELFSDRSDLGEFHALFNYQKGGIVQKMLKGLKYAGSKEIGIGLGELLGSFLNKHGVLNDADGFVAVPLHPAKVARRGYNQSTMIVQGLREHLNHPDLSYLIERTEFTESQTSKSRYERFENMDHVFACRNPHKVSGLNLILVDDVITTGSTMKACMNVLSNAGAARLSVLTLAVA